MCRNMCPECCPPKAEIQGAGQETADLMVFGSDEPVARLVDGCMAPRIDLLAAGLAAGAGA